MSLISFQDPLDAEVDYPRPDRLISAHNPQRLTRNYFQSKDGALDAGLWECEQGHWAIQFPPHKDEVFTVIQGLVRLHHKNGESWEIGPGQSAVIPGGFEGSFEVVDRVLKSYVIYQSSINS